MARRAPGALPTGTLTFLFSDIEGSTRLVGLLGPAWQGVLERHQELLREAIRTHDGVEVSTEGDSFFVVFRSAADAVAAAADAQRALAAEPWPPAVGQLRVRMGLHSGEATVGGDNYVGLDVHRAARIANAAHGGQILLSGATRALVAGGAAGVGELKELGEFRLKDLDQPERLTQLAGPGLAAEFPPPRTLEAPSNLPPPLIGFVGREREIEALAERLTTARLVTLTGPGGTGKTTLSLNTARRLAPAYRGGAFFVDLSTISDASLVASEIAHALRLREDPAVPLEDALVAHLKDRRLLLVLDNLEQFRDGVPLVGRLIAAAPDVAILATSREPLHLRGEQEFPVPPLALPSPGLSADQLSAIEAVALFVQRAQAVRPDFELSDTNAGAVAEICSRLDGLPLAIELAAARSKLLGPEAILARLGRSLAFLSSSARDLPERQRTLRGAIDWSFDLLEPAERVFFARLSVFVGGCSVEAAQAVCEPDDAFEALAALVDKSLLVGVAGADGEPRFRMLETIRGYAAERLADPSIEADEEATRRRHQDYFCQLARTAEPELLDSSEKTWLDRLEDEHDNLRAAILRAADDGRIELALDTGAALWRFWQQRSHLAEGRALLEGVLARPEAAARTVERARAIGALGGLIYWQGNFPAALETYEESLAIQREHGNPAGVAEELYNAGFTATILDLPDRARACYDEALAIYEAIGDSRGLLRVREALVFLTMKSGDYALGRELQESNLEAFRKAGARFRIANALTQLGSIELFDGRYEKARERYAEGFELFRQASDMPAIVRVTFSSAALANAVGDHLRAAELRGAADTLKAPLGAIALPMQVLGIPDPEIAARQALGDEAYAAAYEAGRRLDLDEIEERIAARARP